MSQKFIGLDDAAEQLGVSKDRLNELREAGKVRAYRDGSSWKFRSEDIDKMAVEGLPPADSSASGLSLEQAPEVAEAEEPAAAEESAAGDESAAAEEPAAEPEGSEIELADEEEAANAAMSDLQLEEIDEPTVPVDAVEEEASDDELQLSESGEASESADSILLSEAELGDFPNRPPSTIIGKAEVDPEGDLSFSLAGEEEASESSAPPASAGSDVLSAGDRVDEVLEIEPPSPSESFENLEELEIDLEAESSRVLSPGDVSKAKKAAEASGVAAKQEEDDAASSSETRIVDSAVDLGGETAGSSLGLVGSSPIELEADEDDDQVLGEGSDITLSSESSGINIVSPSDSGLALDEVPLELSGASALGSSLDLGSGVGQESDATSLGVGEAEAAPAEGEEPFTLTPLSEEAVEEEEDSSQVIALDEISEEEAGPLVGAEAGVGADLGEDFGAIGLTGGVMAAAEPTVETPFSLPNILSLALCLLLLAICGMMTFDLLRNIWSWDGVTALNSSILELLNWFL